MKPKVVVICGPTAVGKTVVSLKSAGIFNGEIINADSMQVYRYMDIGTAKPTIDEQKLIPHHLIDILNPDEPFDAAQFAKEGRSLVYSINKKGKIPFVVGGTGLYIKALLFGLFNPKISVPFIRDRLKKEAKEYGSAFMHNRLVQCDKDASLRIHPNDTFRIVRALEIFESTGKSLSQYHLEHQFLEEPFDALKIGLFMNREKLYERIDQRVDKMIEAGFISEVKMILDMGFTEDIKSMQSLGYRHLTDFIKCRLSWDEAIRTLKRDTRHYAKRQLTWFNRDSDISWIGIDESFKSEDLIYNFIKKC